MIAIEMGDGASLASAQTAALHRGRDFVTPVRDGGAGRYEAFSDVIRLADGRIMVVFYAGYSHVSSPNELWPHGGRIGYSISADEGLTWLSPKVLFDGPDDDRDPSIARLPDGRLACNFFMYPSGDVYVVYSSDEGASWSEPQRVVERNGTSSPVRVLSTDRLLLPMYCAVMRSDDAGATWQKVPITEFQRDGKTVSLTETDVIELADGTVYAIHRADGGEPMYCTRSSDGVQTWGQTMPLGFEGHCPYLFRADDDLIVLGYRGVPEPGRFNTQLRYSKDEGNTWSEPVVIDDLLGAYPSMVALKDGSILVVYYEEGVNSDIRARKFRIGNDGIHWLEFEGADNR